jgi:hypothetical protein
MLCFCKTLHVLSVALWFGSVAFFTIAGLLIFQAFADLSRQTELEHPWFPRPAWRGVLFDEHLDGFPNPVRLEQGSRTAGFAVSAIFPVYYGLQWGCGIVALITALGIARLAAGRGHRWRIALCVLALATVGLGWWLEMVVSELREPRNELTDAVLSNPDRTQDQIDRALAARAAFGRWHGYSLMQNFATLALVTVLTGMAGHLPGRPSPPGPLSH